MLCAQQVWQVSSSFHSSRFGATTVITEVRFEGQPSMDYFLWEFTRVGLQLTRGRWIIIELLRVWIYFYIYKLDSGFAKNYNLFIGQYLANYLLMWYITRYFPDSCTIGVLQLRRSFLVWSRDYNFFTKPFSELYL